MTLEQLRIFVAVAEREHLTRAAEALHLTQSAVSSAIAALENRYGIALFDRVGRGLVLTQAGRVFLDEARGVLARARSAEQVLRDTEAGLTGALHVAASQTVGNDWIAPRLADYHARHPGILLKLSIANTEVAAARVLSGDCEIGVVEGGVDDPRLSVTAITGDRAVLALPDGHALAEGDLTAQAVAELRFVVREDGSGTRTMLNSWLAGFGLSSSGNVAMEMSSNEAVLHAVQSGAGASVVSELVARRGGVAVRDIGLPARSFHIIRLKERGMTRMETALIDICKA